MGSCDGTARFSRHDRARSLVSVAILAGLTAGIAAGLVSCNQDERVENTASRAKQVVPSGDLRVGPAAGRWHEPRHEAADADLSEAQLAEIARLGALGYASGVHEGGTLSGVTRHDPERAGQGLLLLASAHAPSAQLIDRAGNVRHRWWYGYKRAFPDRLDVRKVTTFWRRTHLYENGDLLAIFDGAAIIKIDKDSKLLWKSAVTAHHDMAVLKDGSLWVLTREAGVIPRVDPEQPVLEDFVSLLDAQGQELRRISILEALERSEFKHYWDGGLGIGGDLFHMNSIERLDGSAVHIHPAFREGNLLMSSRHLDILVVLDPDLETIVWAMSGAFNAQHDPQLIGNGNILVYDNNPLGGASRVVELDLASGEERWVYQGSEAEPFYSKTCGLAQRLPGGNTLITETDYGRAFEVTRSGDIVWEFYNPFRAGDQGQYIATMMEMKRLRPDFPLDWLDSPR